MNCNTFHDRLQQSLDCRRRPEADAELVQHTEHCPACRQRLEVWQSVAKLMHQLDHPQSSSRDRAEHRPARHWVAVGAVAAACLMVLLPTLLRDRPSPTISPTSDVVSGSERFMGQTGFMGQNEFLASIDLQRDPAQWWLRVQRGDWVGSTMPTVRTVQEGVAPLGRTLMRAMTILTLGASEQTS